MTRNFEYNLESLRGFAAFFVVLDHVAGRFDNWLDPAYKPANIKTFETPGHFSVLIFFVLSGYVIGVSQKERLSGSNIVLYLKKRLVRLYPIYLISVILTLLVAQSLYTSSAILGHLTFTQVLLTPVFSENTALWSLHYEVIFYLLFIPISFFDIRPFVMGLVTLAIGLANLFLYRLTDAPIITSYMFGFTFWLGGLTIAKSFPLNKINNSFSRLLSSILLILALGSGVLGIMTRILDTLNVFVQGKLAVPESVDWYKHAITAYDFALLPYCIMFILIFTNKSFKYRNIIFALLLVLPVLSVSHIAKSNLRFQEYYLSIIYYLASVFLYVCRFNIIEVVSKKIINFGSWMGSLSYALYVIHMPILFAFSLTTFFSGSITTYVFRLIFYLVIVFLISYILEKQVQKLVKRYFFPETKYNITTLPVM